MGQFRCGKCRQLQFKHKVKGERVEIEVKCYACNYFNYFTIWLSNILKGVNKNNHNNEKNNQQK